MMLSVNAGQSPIIPKTGVMAYGQTQSRICVSWAPVTNATQYRVFVNGTYQTTRAVLYYPHLGLSAGTTNTYTVLADIPNGTSVFVGKDTASTLSSGALQVKDDFESILLGSSSYIQGWLVQNPTITVSTDVARTGKRSCKLYYPYSDVLVGDPHHCEIGSNTLYAAPVNNGHGFWWGWSSYMDDSYSVIDNTDNIDILWQWHGAAFGPSSKAPPIALYMIGRTLGVYVNINDAPNTTKVLISNTWDVSADLNRWVDCVGYAVFDYTNGRIKIWKDGTQIVDYTGPTLYHIINQQNENGCYINLGPYKYTWDTNPTLVSQRTMYFDEIRIADDTGDYNTVAPGT